MIIPALDLIDGQVVRLFQGDYAKATQYATLPLAQFQRYQASGANWLHLVDLSGAKNPEHRQLTPIRELIDATAAKIQLGGGIRHQQEVEELLKAGAQRVVIGSKAVTSPTDVKAWMRAFGAERVVLALDVHISSAGDKNVAISGWQHTSDKRIETLLDEYLSEGLIHVLCTDISKDGTLTGANVALYQDLCHQYPMVDIQASGGIGSLDDIAALKPTGVKSVILGRALLDGHFSVKEAIRCWQNG